MIGHSYVDLQPYINSFGATYDTDRAGGVLNAWGNSFPAEELPFGATLIVANTPFCLPAKERGAYDHVEARGQTIALPGSPTALGIALLCCGEMGDQETAVHVCGAGRTYTFEAVAQNWLRSAAFPPSAESYACSHLHYVGGYELPLLWPALSCVRFQFEAACVISSLRLDSNPLFHVFALTILHTVPA